jgi:thiosulfate dehydrogenase
MTGQFARWLALAGSMLCAGAPAAAFDPGAVTATGQEASLIRGGLLYDKWFKQLKAPTPAAPHPSYPESGRYRGIDGTDWRCKECHGWDYRGKDGAYARGSHYSGIKGIDGMAGAPSATIAAIIRDQRHAYLPSMLSDEDVRDLATFVSRGQVDTDRFIDRATKLAKGDKNNGRKYFEGVCASCHGSDGRKFKDEGLGDDARDNPWEVLHKLRVGHPGEAMPAMLVFEESVTADLLAYLQTMPAAKPAPRR